HFLNADATADGLAFLATTLASVPTARSPLDDARGVIATRHLIRPAAGSWYVSLVSTEGSPGAAADPAFTLKVGSTTWSVALRPSDGRERSLPPGTSILYESGDLPPAAVPPGVYDDALVMLVLAPGQVVPPHMHGGIEPTYVIEGAIELRVRGRPPRVLS